MRTYYILMIVFLMTAVCAESYAQRTANEVKPVNALALTFIKANGKPIDFKMGLSISEGTDIQVSVSADYELSELKVMLVRGKWPVSSSTYNSQSNEILVEWKDFANAQTGDRLCIDFVVVKERKGSERIPVVLDVPVFNIPLN